MPWRPLQRIAFAICTYPFHPSSPADLPLQVGDELYIIEQGGQDGAWYRGYLVAPPSLLAGLTSTKGRALEARVFSGIFPRDCVEIRELLGDVTVQASDAQQDPDAVTPATPHSVAPTQSEEDVPGPVPAAPLPEVSPAPTPTLDPISPVEAVLSTSPDAASAAAAPAVPTPSQPVDTTTLPDTIETQPIAPQTLRDAVAHASAERRSYQQSHRMSQHAARDRSSRPLTLRPAYANPRISVAPSDARAPVSAKPPAPVPLLKIGDESATSKDEPLVDEIASCLREWHSTNLHELLLSRKYGLLDEMSNLVVRLDAVRRQLLHKILTKHELALLRESAVWDLVNGNKAFNGDVVVRSTAFKGRILTSDDSAVEISRLQAIMSQLHEPPTQNIESRALYHLLFELKQLETDGEKSSNFSISLYNKPRHGAPKLLSEIYHVDGADFVTDDGIYKTLFTDMSAADVGDVNSEPSKICMVVKVVTSEPVRTVKPATPDLSSSRERLSDVGDGVNGTNRRPDSKQGGRQSLMWGNKVRKKSDAMLKASSSSLSLGPDQQAESINGAASVKEQKPVKRVTGIGLIDISVLMKTQDTVEWQIPIRSPASYKLFASEEDRGWDDFVRELNSSVGDRFPKSPSVRAMTVQLKAFKHGGSDELIQATPTLLQNIQQTQRIGFSGAPTKPRSDIYFTFKHPSLPQNAVLAHPKTGNVPLPANIPMENLQLTMEVRNASGDRIENCIYPSSSQTGHTAWRTIAADRDECWNQTIKLVVPTDEVPGSHVIMSLANGYNFPFALSWIPLWTQEAFLRDGDQSLILYAYDETTSSVVGGKGAYLSLPWSVKTTDEAVIGPPATLQISTYLCSTYFSQDPNLLGLLKWRDRSASEIVTLLNRFTFVPEIESVKLLGEVFDALFGVLVEYAGTEEVEDLVFNALVTVLGIVHDRRFDLGPHVEEYTKNDFHYPFVFPCLVRSFTRLFANPTDQETSRRLRAASKVGGHILKFIIAARQQQVSKEVGIGLKSHEATFAADLDEIFVAAQNLMRNNAPVLVGTKTLVVQHFHSWLPELMGVLKPTEVLVIATNFINSCTEVQGKLILYKLVLINNISKFEIFDNFDIRSKWRISTIKWLAPYWGIPHSPQPPQQQREQIRLCCAIVATQISERGPEGHKWIPELVQSFKVIQSLPNPPQNSLSLLFPSTYPFTTKSSSSKAVCDEALVEIAALLATFSYDHRNYPFQLQREEFGVFLVHLLQVFKSILTCQAFPATWLSLHIFQHKSILRALNVILGLLTDLFLPHPDDAEEFNTELWRLYLSTLLDLVGSDALALETFPEQKRRAVWKIGGDIRELGAELLQRSWHTLGWESSVQDKANYGLDSMSGYQVQYVPGLVGPIVELCLSVHDGLRTVAIRVLRTMIVNEWALTQDLGVIQAETIESLDNTFKEKGLHDGVLQKFFVGELISLFEPSGRNPHDPFFVAVREFINTVDELLELLVDVHNTDSNGETFRILDTLRLMAFLRDMQKEKIYIGYVHKLAQIQAASGNPIEAGLALRMHAELYEWNPSTSVIALEVPQFPAQTSFERKEQIYLQMIKHFEDGLAWHHALSAYAELAMRYENVTFDFAKLARTQRAMANVYERIARGERRTPRYFRVVFRGLGFPLSLRDKQFIFEASSTDRLGTFTDKLQQQYPSARITSDGAVDELEGQYLSVFPVNAQKQLLHPVNRRPRIAQAVRDYFMLAETNQFTITSRRQAAGPGLAEQMQEKVVFITADVFPTVLQRSEIVTIETVRLSPIEVGLERTVRKTSELVALERRTRDGDELTTSSLTDGLKILVNPQSGGSVAGYWELIHPSYSKREEGAAVVEEPDLDPVQEALRVALFEHATAIARCLELYNKPVHMQIRTELSRGKVISAKYRAVH